MTIRDKVLKIYSDAVCFKDLHADKFDHNIFCIMKGPVENISLSGPWYRIAYGWFTDTEQNAWNSAWDHIQHKMINQLEE